MSSRAPTTTAIDGTRRTAAASWWWCARTRGLEPAWGGHTWRVARRRRAARTRAALVVCAHWPRLDPGQGSAPPPGWALPTPHSALTTGARRGGGHHSGRIKRSLRCGLSGRSQIAVDCSYGLVYPADVSGVRVAFLKRMAIRFFLEHLPHGTGGPAGGTQLHQHHSRASTAPASSLVSCNARAQVLFYCWEGTGPSDLLDATQWPSAPARCSAAATSCLPRARARCSAVHPCALGKLRSAPAAMRASTAPSLPCSAARARAVLP